MKHDISFDLPSGTVTFKDVDLPDAGTPLPQTNATIHILLREDGYGTPNRKFTALCGTSWLTKESSGEHKYFYASETHWYKHVNCSKCKALSND